MEGYLTQYSTLFRSLLHYFKDLNILLSVLYIYVEEVADEPPQIHNGREAE